MSASAFPTHATPAGLILAAPATGSGKTTVTLGLLRALRRQDAHIAAFKVGPDYIDSAFHAAALQDAAHAGINLDGWAMDDRMIGALRHHHAGDASLVVGEGVMGLFDGAKGVYGQDEHGRGDGSTADLAARLGLPVVLVIDAKRQGVSLAALVQGFARFRADVTVGGVILNRVSSDAHAALLRDALMRSDPALPLLGCLPDDPALALPSRHLGLVQAREHAALDRFTDHAAEVVMRHFDLETLVGLAKPLRTDGNDTALLPPLGQRIAVARDDAFAFAYPAMLDGWRRAGADLVFFSPLADEPALETADAVCRPGGYPELYAGRIAANRRFLDSLRQAAARGAFIYGECGGYMVLGETLTDADGAVHPMTGLLPLATSFAERRLHLGYRQASLAVSNSPFGRLGRRWRGHEFHYATVLNEGGAESPSKGGVEPLLKTTDAAGNIIGFQGLRCGTTMGSFVHLIAEAERA
jgi:cobyrinic acid a,c-diamide synthase